MSIFEIISDYKIAFLSGLKTTLLLCVIIWLSGLVIGSVLGFLSSYYKIVVGIPVKAISFVLTGIPVLVFLFWLHYPFQEIIGRNFDPFFTTALAISLVNIFAVASVVRNAINDLPAQYIEVAKVCGMSKRKQILNIELPLVFRSALPSFLVIQVNMLHLTLFGSLVSVNEIFKVSQQINSQIYQPIEIYTALGVFFLIICLPINATAAYLRLKYLRNLSER